MRLLGKDQLKEKLGISTQTTIDQIVKGANFPAPLDIPHFSHNRWLESDIDKWLEEMPRKERKTA
jgi:predicted DNA-binding transcriptional regulator AlpA